MEETLFKNFLFNYLDKNFTLNYSNNNFLINSNKKDSFTINELVKEMNQIFNDVTILVYDWFDNAKKKLLKPFYSYIEKLKLHDKSNEQLKNIQTKIAKEFKNLTKEFIEIEFTKHYFKKIIKPKIDNLDINQNNFDLKLKEFNDSCFIFSFNLSIMINEYFKEIGIKLIEHLYDDFKNNILLTREKFKWNIRVVGYGELNDDVIKKYFKIKNLELVNYINSKIDNDLTDIMINNTEKFLNYDRI